MWKGRIDPAQTEDPAGWITRHPGIETNHLIFAKREGEKAGLLSVHCLWTGGKDGKSSGKPGIAE